jgi:hypothetical protein
MRILLDECLPLDFRHSFPTHEPHTAQWAGLKGKNNGELLRAAEAAGYDVLLTVDQGIPHQQYFAGRKLSAILVGSLPLEWDRTGTGNDRQRSESGVFWAAADPGSARQLEGDVALAVQSLA